MKLRVLICDPIHQDGVKLLRDAGCEVVEKPKITQEQLLLEAKNFDVLVVRGRTKITAEVVAVAPSLKAVARSGVGLDNIDLEAAKKRGIAVLVHAWRSCRERCGTCNRPDALSVQTDTFGGPSYETGCSGRKAS